MARLALGLKPADGHQGETKPHLLLATAASYASAADNVLKAQSSSHIPALFLLAGFSIELALKAFILQKSGNPDILKKISHDLSKAWAKSLELGLDTATSVIPHNDFDWLIKAASPHHNAMTFRYMPDVQTFKVDCAPPDMIKAACALCALVRPHIQMPE